MSFLCPPAPVVRQVARGSGAASPARSDWCTLETCSGCEACRLEGGNVGGPWPRWIAISGGGRGSVGCGGKSGRAQLRGRAHHALAAARGRTVRRERASDRRSSTCAPIAVSIRPSLPSLNTGSNSGRWLLLHAHQRGVVDLHELFPRRIEESAIWLLTVRRRSNVLTARRRPQTLSCSACGACWSPLSKRQGHPHKRRHLRVATAAEVKRIARTDTPGLCQSSHLPRSRPARGHGRGGKGPWWSDGTRMASTE